MYTEAQFYEICKCCGGSGGFDVSRDCEVYDQWEECTECGGTGEEEE